MGRRKYRVKYQVIRPNQVCLRCRVTAKGNTECPNCHGPMENLGHIWRPPRKGDARGWATVARFVAAKRARNLGAADSPTHGDRDKPGFPEPPSGPFICHSGGYSLPPLWTRRAPR